jgi:hypothetical protein
MCKISDWHSIPKFVSRLHVLWKHGMFTVHPYTQAETYFTLIACFYLVDSLEISVQFYIWWSKLMCKISHWDSISKFVFEVRRTVSYATNFQTFETKGLQFARSPNVDVLLVFFQVVESLSIRSVFLLLSRPTLAQTVREYQHPSPLYAQAGIYFSSVSSSL